MKHSADVVHVSSSSDESSEAELERDADSWASAESLDSTEIMNTTDLRGDDSAEEEDASSVTGVHRRSAEQFASNRFLLHEQRFVNGFNRHHAQPGKCGTLARTSDHPH